MSQPFCLTAGLGSTLVSRMIINLRIWNRLDDDGTMIIGRPPDTHVMVELASRDPSRMLRQKGKSVGEAESERRVSVHIHMNGRDSTDWVEDEEAARCLSSPREI